jgi:ribonucleotide reductase alpha subunit
LADAFAMLDLSWVIPSGSTLVLNPKVEKLNDQIFETIYFAAVRKSIELAKIHGRYQSFDGSPTSDGVFQFDLWDREIDPRTNNFRGAVARKSRYTQEQWNNLRLEAMNHGLRNSLLIALMPTASTAHILGNNECFEPFMELISSRTVLSGQYVLVNKHLVRDLQEIGLWTPEVIQNIISNQGSIQNLDVKDFTTSQIKRVEHLKLKYLTVFEMPQRPLVKLSADRGRFVCQTQSFNCFMKNPTGAKMRSFLMAGWQEGLKTGMYYLRTPAVSAPIDFTAPSTTKPKNVVCTDEVCTVCSA